jgi:hypothetical protein
MADEVKNEEVQAQSEEKKVPTVEELQAEIERLKAENGQNEKLKKSVSEACADAAEWKRKYRATLDEAERLKQEQADELAALKQENATFRAEKRTSTYFEKLVDAGYSPETAKNMAASLPDGVEDSFFEQQKSFLSNKTQEIKNQILNSQPGLSTGMPPASASENDNQLRKWFGLPTK